VCQEADQLVHDRRPKKREELRRIKRALFGDAHSDNGVRGTSNARRARAAVARPFKRVLGASKHWPPRSFTDSPQLFACHSAGQPTNRML